MLKFSQQLRQKQLFKLLNVISSDNGLPRVLVTDNGSQFTSNFFGEFCKLHGINHIRSPVYMPQSNGQAERMVDIVKRFVKKNILRLGPNLNLNNCINEFLLGYRSTPSTATPGNISPAMAHLGREIRNSLDLMKPLQEKLYAPDIQMEKQFNSQYGARLRHFNVNDNVWARKMKSSPWFEGRIIARQGSRLYDIIDLNEPLQTWCCSAQ
uniref:Integrase catalytic domain-containing protein n=1 Tax=Panagrolaimus superbus TaxID=310955 RepID=A0A914Z321_9BILA